MQADEHGPVAGHGDVLREVPGRPVCDDPARDRRPFTVVVSVAESDLASEAVRSSEGLCNEPREVVHVIGLAGTEQRLQKRVG
jgi:hypothetical protein